MMVNRILTFMSIVLISAFGFACQSKDLTRDRAKAVIEASPLLRTRYLVASWEKTGMFQQVVRGGEVQPAYQPYFTSARQIRRMQFVELALRNPLIPKVVGITGISDGATPGEKNVDFEWAYSSVPDELKEFVVVSTPIARATMKLYDDGWRVERIDWQSKWISYDPEP